MLYRDAGVDVTRMQQVKQCIAHMVTSTFSPYVVSEIGHFASLCRLPKMENPLVVASCDGVGTKLLIAKMMRKFDTVGVDLVNHCVNDILTLGAKPLFFLDYIAHADLSNEQIALIVKGVVRGCKYNDCALVGGETAMMPDVYKTGDFDLVGFIVGVVEQNSVIDANRLKPGDLVIGLPSSGLHTNGYSLVRKIFFQQHKFTLNSRLKGLKRSIGEELLRPHRSYYKKVYPLLGEIKAIAHITGGGFYENIQRLLPPERSCVIKKSAWPVPRLFRYIQMLGSIPDTEMFRTFNMGIGMVIFVEPSRLDKIMSTIGRVYIIGKIVRGNFGVELI
ncbi:MAG: phosphoribosylformylglycinamidine cyclo-ligase [candidate division WOR-3 bacterium]